MTEQPLPEQIEIISPDAIISVDLSTGYYKRIQDMVGFFVAGKSADQLKEAHQQIQTSEITQEWVFHYETLLILCKEVENLARQHGHVTLVNVTDIEA